jgi:hypothetical protein
MQEAQQLMLAGETFDHEYQPTEAGNLQLEVSSLGVNVVQQIEIR